MPDDPTSEVEDAARRRRGRVTPSTDRRVRDIYSEIDRLAWRQDDFKDDFKELDKRITHIATDVETVRNALQDLQRDFNDQHRRLFGFGPTEPGALGRIEAQVQQTPGRLQGSAAVTILKWGIGIIGVILAAVILAYVFHVGSLTTK